MVIDAEKTTGPVLATAKDPRVTPLGDFLRATRLDELPQLWNVLRGDMSLVGPRPERPFFVHQFEAELPDYPLRHIVRPGLTGLAQVMGKYGSSAQDKLRYDLYYIRHYSVWLDVKLMLLTVWAVVNKRGASELGPHGMDAESAAQEMLAHRSITSLSRPQGD
jgi:lipopolysaccharide/colanic/teichoic acid biosynthesis glycosyltransferase